MKAPVSPVEAGDDIVWDGRETIEGIEDGPEWHDTGLIDADGKPIMRRIRTPMGFMR